ncbi:MAG: 7-cyano-7-deazaguanine synthase QueC [Proteobacteria bacterium]|nr:7-cyano-7-deazaguanine synthase QueC [Pseudomonadota bacterium]
MKTKKAVILVSGGLDSATVLAMARDQGYDCYALSFDYGQRHRCELDFARRVTKIGGAITHKIVDLNLGWMGGSALTDMSIPVPDADTANTDTNSDSIPSTYVPARNTVFLSYALAWAEVLQAHDIFIGANAVDYSGYPDCRPAFIEAFEQLANLATKEGVEGSGFSIHAPLIHMTKAEIIHAGTSLGVDYGLTSSCYQPDDECRACGHCDSCHLRAKGFADAGVADPTRYQAGN